MSGRKIAYGRVSTKEQKLDRQIIAFQELGISPKNIFIEKQSGKDFDHPIYQKMIKLLKKGDTLIIKSIDRLRNYRRMALSYAREANKHSSNRHAFDKYQSQP